MKSDCFLSWNPLNCTNVQKNWGDYKYRLVKAILAISKEDCSELPNAGCRSNGDGLWESCHRSSFWFGQVYAY